MTPKELAEKLDGRQYRAEVTKGSREAALNAGLVIVYGASDDLIEFSGAIDDEAGAYEGGSVMIDAKGILPEYDRRVEWTKSESRDYFRREKHAKEIKAIWDRDNISWQYETDIPHETFKIMEDGGVYCIGIVFAVSDI